jgi:hypothetical protein
MSKTIHELIQFILHLLIITILSFILEDFVFRWEFWVIMTLVVLIRVVDVYYIYDE